MLPECSILRQIVHGRAESREHENYNFFSPNRPESHKFHMFAITPPSVSCECLQFIGPLDFMTDTISPGRSRSDEFYVAAHSTKCAPP